MITTTSALARAGVLLVAAGLSAFQGCSKSRDEDRQYRQMGETIFNDFVKHCRTEVGYAALSNIVT